MIPRYIEERIRRPAPPGAYIVPQSTPVVAFGNSRAAKVATLGLNPSRVEFLGEDCALLDGGLRRLATHISLGNSDLLTAPKMVVARVLEDCDNYFQRRPYRRWFDQLLPVLTTCGGSYYDGSACHLDLVQWATDPTWSRIKPASVKKQLISEDARFLEQQLGSENIRLLLINGAGAFTQFRRLAASTFVTDRLTRIEGFAANPTTVCTGKGFGRLQFVAWSTNLQSSRGVTRALREELPRAIASLL